MELRTFLIISVAIRFLFAFLGAGDWKLEAGKGQRHGRDVEFGEGIMGLFSKLGAGLDCGFFGEVKRRFMARLAGGPFRRRFAAPHFVQAQQQSRKQASIS